MRKQELLNTAERIALENYSTAERLNHCTAWTITGTTGDVVLQSYNTYVACYNHNNGTVYVFDYYSATTCQHISKFITQVNANRVVYLYRRSDRAIEWDIISRKLWKLTKKEYESLKAIDFTTYITNKW